MRQLAGLAELVSAIGVDVPFEEANSCDKLNLKSNVNFEIKFIESPF